MAGLPRASARGQGGHRDRAQIAILFYNAMRFGMSYQDPGADHYERKYRERVIEQLHRRAAEFGFTLQEAGGVS